MSHDRVASPVAEVERPSGFAVGMTFVAAVIMMVAGVFQTIESLIARLDDTFDAVGQQ